MFARGVFASHDRGMPAAEVLTETLAGDPPMRYLDGEA